MERESLIAQGETFLRSISNGPDKSLSKKISSLESLGFSPNEINEVLKRLGTSINVGVGNNGGNLASLMLNNVIPSLIILGTGALVFFLTGGEDEVNEPLPIEEVTNSDGSALNRSIMNEHDNGGSRNNYLDQTQGYDGEDSPRNNQYLDAFEGSQHQKQRLDIGEGIDLPEWVKELQLKTDMIAAEVTIMKEALLKLSLNSDKSNKSENEKEAESVVVDTDAVSDDASTEIAVEEKDVIPLPILTVEDYLDKLRTVVREMSQQYQCPPISKEAVSGLVVGHNNEPVAKEETSDITNSDNKTSESTLKSPVKLSPLMQPDIKEDQGAILTVKDEEVFKLGCGTLMMYVSKVLEQPSVPRYRKIATSNASYKSIVLPLEGHIEVLSAVGFKRNESGNGNFEWTWRVDADQIVSKGGIQRPDESGQTVILTECVRLLGIGRTEGSFAVITALNNCINDSATLIVNDNPADQNCVPVVNTSGNKDPEEVANILGHTSMVSSDTNAIESECKDSKHVDKKAVTFQEPALQEPLSPTPPISPLGFSEIMQIAMNASAEKLKTEKIETDVSEPEVNVDN